MTIDEKLKEIKERYEKATEGKWFYLKSGGEIKVCLSENKNHKKKCPKTEHCHRCIANVYSDFNDATFIAHARDDVPKLVKALENTLTRFWYADDTENSRRSIKEIEQILNV